MWFRIEVGPASTGATKDHGKRQSNASDVPVPSPGRTARGRPVASEQGVAAFELMLVALVVGLLVVIVLPALLRTSPRADNIDAQANLRNAVDGARDAYAPSQSYSYRGLPLSTLSFASSAPAYSWTTGSCADVGPDCLSEQVVDVNMPGDSQGVVLATWSSVTRTCWYAVDLETVPRVLASDRSGIAFEVAPNTDRSLSGAGIYYGRSPSGASSCSAKDATRDSGHGGWSSNLSSAGVVG
jgi:type II secretory pathway pseudopilin PulG